MKLLKWMHWTRLIQVLLWKVRELSEIFKLSLHVDKMYIFSALSNKFYRLTLELQQMINTALLCFIGGPLIIKLLRTDTMIQMDLAKRTWIGKLFTEMSTWIMYTRCRDMNRPPFFRAPWTLFFINIEFLQTKLLYKCWYLMFLNVFNQN